MKRMPSDSPMTVIMACRPRCSRAIPPGAGGRRRNGPRCASRRRLTGQHRRKRRTLNRELTPGATTRFVARRMDSCNRNHLIQHSLAAGYSLQTDARARRSTTKYRRLPHKSRNLMVMQKCVVSGRFKSWRRFRLSLRSSSGQSLSDFHFMWTR